jgi:hypothetical protein
MAWSMNPETVVHTSAMSEDKHEEGRALVPPHLEEFTERSRAAEDAKHKTLDRHTSRLSLPLRWQPLEASTFDSRTCSLM